MTAPKVRGAGEPVRRTRATQKHPAETRHTEPNRRRGPRRWWLWPGGVGLVLLLIPVLALAVTNRDPDPLFLHFWWSPIASTPTDALLLGTLGLTVLLATALTALLSRLIGDRHRLGEGLKAALVLLISAAVVGTSFVVAAGRADTSGAAIRAVLLRERPPASVSAQATRALELALGWPAVTADGIRIVHRSTVPAGPWLVQTTEVLNQNVQDEASDVTVETLVDPADGSIEAAWFYGL